MADPSSLTHSTTQEYNVYSYNACTAYCVLTLTAPDVDEQERAPVSCTFVLDISGSMGGTKLKLMKEAGEFSVRQLSSKDYLGLIAFDSNVHNILTPGGVNEAHRSRAVQQVRALQIGSCTNLAGALFEGIKQQNTMNPTSQPHASPTSPVLAPGATATTSNADNNQAATPSPPDTPSAAQPVRSVFVFTDGIPTVGVRDTESILKVMDSMLPAAALVAPEPAPGSGDDTLDAPATPTTDATAAGPPAIKVHTFGFGSDVDANLLARIAERGSGSFYYISNPDDIPTAFADALGGILSVAAQNVVLRITPANGAHIIAVRSGFPTAAEGSSHVVRLPDVYAEEAKDIVVAFALPSMHGEDVPEDVEFTAAHISIEFIDTVHSRPAVVTGEMRVKRSAEAEADAVPAGASPHVRAQMTRLNTMDAMLQAMTLADRGDFGQARGVLHGIEEALQSLAVTEAPDDASDSDASAAAAMVAQLRLDVRNMSAGYASRDSYHRGGGRAFTAMMSNSHAQQRSTLPTRSSPAPSHPPAGRSQAHLPTFRQPPAAGSAPLDYLQGIGAPVALAPTGARAAPGLPQPPSPGSTRPRSGSGAEAVSPAKKSRMRQFMGQVQNTFRRPWPGAAAEVGAAEGGAALAPPAAWPHAGPSFEATPVPQAALFGPPMPPPQAGPAPAPWPDASLAHEILQQPMPTQSVSVYSNRRQATLVKTCRGGSKE